MVRWLRQGAALALVALSEFGAAEAAPRRTPAPAGAVVYFQSPQEGSVRNPVVVRAGLSGMGVAPAGEAAQNAGHHNVLVDTKPGDPALPLQGGPGVIQLKNGETEVALDFSRGWHQIQLVLTDGNDMNFDPPIMSKPISVYVRRR